MPKPPRLENLLSCRVLPIRYLFIPKCGCTFVKNLIWRLDHGATYDNPSRIHDRMEEFARITELGLTPEAIRAEEHAFVILRHPIDRFLSLYFDKVVGQGWLKFVPLRATLQAHGLEVEAATPEAHIRNLHLMIDWLEENLAGKNELPRDAHWAPQFQRTATIRGYDLKVLPINGLTGRMSLLLGDLVPGIAPILGQMERYATNSKDRKEALMVPALKSRIIEVYRRDRENYLRLRDVWTKADPKTSAEIPRGHDVFPD